MYICTVFPPLGGTMALPHPLVFLSHHLILNLMLIELHCFTTLLTKHDVPLMHFSTLHIVYMYMYVYILLYCTCKLMLYTAALQCLRTLYTVHLINYYIHVHVHVYDSVQCM